jgi:nicotinamide-nucleotide amidase
MAPSYPIESIGFLKDSLLSAGRTIAVAESVTAGQLQAALSLAENARRFFQGGVTVYNVGQKCRQLGVEPIHAIEVNGVSERIAEQMALHVAELFRAHIGVAVTGYAGPVPEKNILSPFAWYSVYEAGQETRTIRLEGLGSNPLEVQLSYVKAIISDLQKLYSARFGSALPSEGPAA